MKTVKLDTFWLMFGFDAPEMPRGKNVRK